MARFMPATQLDKLVWDDPCQILLHPDMIMHALERAHGGEWLPQQLRARIANLARVDQQIERQSQRLLDAYLIEFEQKQVEIEKEQQAVRLQKRQLEATAAERLELSAIADSIGSFCG
jgi:site-specific DNA recombinase